MLSDISLFFPRFSNLTARLRLFVCLLSVPNISSAICVDALDQGKTKTNPKTKICLRIGPGTIQHDSINPFWPKSFQDVKRKTFGTSTDIGICYQTESRCTSPDIPPLGRTPMVWAMFLFKAALVDDKYT